MHDVKKYSRNVFSVSTRNHLVLNFLKYSCIYNVQYLHVISFLLVVLYLNSIFSLVNFPKQMESRHIFFHMYALLLLQLHCALLRTNLHIWLNLRHVPTKQRLIILKTSSFKQFGNPNESIPFKLKFAQPNFNGYYLCKIYAKNTAPFEGCCS